jgi:hypothetical protein
MCMRVKRAPWRVVICTLSARAGVTLFGGASTVTGSNIGWVRSIQQYADRLRN